MDAETFASAVKEWLFTAGDGVMEIDGHRFVKGGDAMGWWKGRRPILSGNFLFDEALSADEDWRESVRIEVWRLARRLKGEDVLADWDDPDFWKAARLRIAAMDRAFGNNKETMS